MHDADIKTVAKTVSKHLSDRLPHLRFRHRRSIKKQEIHEKLHSIDVRLGIKLFVPTASIEPDGGIIEVEDKKGLWRVVLVSESKHQGNDVQNIRRGIRTETMKRKGQYIMPAGNAIERVHKNIQEMRNFMLGERHFPYVIFLQGSNFAIRELVEKWPNGPLIHLRPSDSGLNRIDRVTACNFGMEINTNYCRNLVIESTDGPTMLQAASVYAQCDRFEPQQMADVLWATALTSLEVLADEVPRP